MAEEKKESKVNFEYLGSGKGSIKLPEKTPDGKNKYRNFSVSASLRKMTDKSSGKARAIVEISSDDFKKLSEEIKGLPAKDEHGYPTKITFFLSRNETDIFE